MSDEELNEWEKNQSFVSYRSVFNTALDEWESLTNASDTLVILNKYQDILTIEDGHLMPTIPVKLYQNICNREGYYQTGNVMNRVIGSKIYSIAKEQMGKLANPNELATNGVQVQTYLLGTTTREFRINSRIEAECGFDMTGSYFDNPSGCSSDRIVYIQFFQSLKSYQDYFFLSDGITKYYRTHNRQNVQILTWGSKKNSLCIWKDYYKTLFDTRNVYYTVYGYYNGNSTPTIYTNPINGSWAVINTNSQLQQFDFTAFNYTGTVEEAAHTIASHDVGDLAINTTLVAPRPVSVHAEAKTRGSGLWAVINCP